jgi:formimidoylglutamate deiminase
VRGGARALGVAQACTAQTGTAQAGIAVGASADIIALDVEAPALSGRSGDALVDSFVFASAGKPVRSVWRAGRKVVADGRHHAREQIAARYRAALARVLA